MFFELENHINEIISVDKITWEQQSCFVLPRYYSALAFRIKGEGFITYDGKQVFVGANDVLYLPQHIGYTAEYTDTDLIVIHFITDKSDCNAEVFSFDNVDKIYKLFLDALNVWNNKDIGYKISTLSILYNILATMYKQTQKHTLPKNFINAVSHINSNYKDANISIKKICEEVGISETYFRKLFAIHYKKKPINYINELRIEYARNLISCGVSIEKATYESGFNDPKYFARVVKKYYDCSPRELKLFGK